MRILCTWTILWGLMAPVMAHAAMINEWEPVETGLETEVIPEEAKSGQAWKETFTGMEFVWIPAGCFKIGSSPKTEGRDHDEGPIHEACVGGHWMGSREVTQGQWRQVMRNNPAFFRKGDDYPVERVAWEDTEIFIKKLNVRYPGRFHFRLPTEAEWEYSCRNGGQNISYAGDNDPNPLAWSVQNSGETTQPTGRRKPNRLGLFDMSGNVWEWAQDTYRMDGYAHGERDNPVITSASPFRVIRGGAWDSEAKSLRCANRGFELFTVKRSNIGFRLVRVIEVVTHHKKGLQDLKKF